VASEADFGARLKQSTDHLNGVRLDLQRANQKILELKNERTQCDAHIAAMKMSIEVAKEYVSLSAPFYILLIDFFCSAEADARKESKDLKDANEQLETA
jgi:hypothetical protein